jgi:uncharacterized protein with HEPN domain
MLANQKNDLLYLLNILESIGKVELYCSGIGSAEEFFSINDQLNFNATLNLLANIGESASKLSEELKIQSSEVDWKRIKGFHNQVAHNYMGIDIYIVFDVVQKDLSKLKASVTALISQNLKSGIFDKEEFAVAKGNQYYRHIDFSAIG